MNAKQFRKFHSEQKTIAECGIACLESIFKTYSFEPNKEILKKLTGTTNAGTTLLGLCEASNKLGLKADGYEGNIRELMKISKPCILHVVIGNNQLHYVVCYGFNHKYFILGDPGRGILEYSPHALDKIWKTKRLLIFSGKVDQQKFNLCNQHRATEKKVGIWKLIEEDIGTLIFSCILGLIVSILSLSLAFFSRILLDDLMKDSPDHDKLAVAILILFLTLSTKNVLNFIREVLFLYQGKNLSIRLNRHFYKKLLNLSISYYESMRTGDLVVRLNDSVRIQNIVNLIFNSLVVDIFLFVAIVLFVSFVAPWLSVVFLLFSVLYFLIAFLQTDKVAKAQNRVIEFYSLNESMYINALQGIDVIKNHNKEDLFSNTTSIVYNFFQESLLQFGKLKNNLNLVYAIMGSLIITLTVILTCQTHFYNGLPIGSLVALIQVALIFVSPITNLALSNFRIQEAKVALERINDFSRAEPEYEKQKDLTKINIDSFEVIKITHLNFKFPGTLKLIENFDLEIKKGDFVALTGNSGVGKSTLIKVLQMFYEIPKKSISVNGAEWNDLSIYQWREVIGVVPQEIKIFNASVANNIVMEENVEFSEIEEFCRKTDLDRFFISMPYGYNTIVGESGITLSGGQKQLIGLARALYKRPELLLLDEATSFLDIKTQTHVFDLLKKLCREKKVAILYVTHDYRLASCADKTIQI